MNQSEAAPTLSQRELITPVTGARATTLGMPSPPFVKFDRVGLVS